MPQDHMKSLLLFISIVAACLFTAEGQYEDVRCKCVCPQVPLKGVNGTETPSRKIWVAIFHEPSNCKCDKVILDEALKTEHKICDRCDCQWQRRNTVTIKVVVIFIICIVSLLVLYMLFLLCLDPFMNKRSSTITYEQHRDEVVDTYTPTPHPRDLQTETQAERAGVISRVKLGVNRISGEQERWKGTVQEQRRHIYERHTMLN